jgi:peroxiredoxin
MSARLPDLDVLDHSGNQRRLSDLVGGDPAILQTYRGPWCPKEQRFFRRLVALQDELEVSYCRLLSLSVDPPEVASAYRAGLGARWPFLCDPDRSALAKLGLRETTDTVHHPYVPRVFVLRPDLGVFREYDGYWFVGRPTNDELVGDLRALTAELRGDYVAPAA